MSRISLTVIGFLLFLFGFLSLIMGLIGLGLYPISIIDKSFNPLVIILIKLIIMVLGFVLFYMSRVTREDEE